MLNTKPIAVMIDQIKTKELMIKDSQNKLLKEITKCCEKDNEKSIE